MMMKQTTWKKRSRSWLTAMICALAVCIVAHDAAAQSTKPTPTASASNDQAQTIDITVGQSRVIDAPWPVKRVSVGEASIADVDVTSPHRIQVKGKAVGLTEITLWNEQGNSWQARLEVKADVSRLQGHLRKLFANDTIQVTQVDDVLAIKGQLARSEDAVQLRQFLTLSKLNFFDLTSVAGLQQVQLQVKIAEVSRTGVRFLTSDFAFTDGLTSAAVNNGASRTYNPDEPAGNLLRSLPGGTTIFGTGVLGDNVFEYFIQALTDNQYLRVLAEPTLVARSGQEAQFLAGGEFPIPVAHVGGGGNTEISIEWKEFGVRLHFTPTVLGDGRIALKVCPEVSQLSDVGSIELLGTRIPSLITRRVETTLELQSGQTFAMAGLINQSDTARVAKIPGIGDLPVLGAMFRSVRYTKNDTEMLVLVTASLVEPTSQELDPPAPGSFHEEPNDWELYAEGRIEGKSRVRVAPAQQERLKRLGLDQLRGPGAWASYDSAPDTIAGQTTKKAK